MKNPDLRALDLPVFFTYHEDSLKTMHCDTERYSLSYGPVHRNCAEIQGIAN